MVGFPTESEEDFLDTIDLVNRCKFAGAFTFVYSKRSGTKAAEMKDQIDEVTKKDRIMRLVELVNKQNRTKSNLYKNEIIEILCENFDKKKNMYLGRDEYGRMAYFKSENSLIGEFVNIKIIKTGGISLTGEIFIK
jgi:tRNA-2-methylthio-N6-dimethylallyladenosine synthase